MEDNKAPKKFKFFNLFDIIVIIIIIALLGVFFVLSRGTVQASAKTSKVTYNLELIGMTGDSAEQIKPGDKLVDKIKKYNIGTVKSVELSTTARPTEDSENGGAWLSPTNSQKTAVMVVEAECTETDKEILIDGGYSLRVGPQVNVVGPGYYGYGYILSIERGDE